MTNDTDQVKESRSFALLMLALAIVGALLSMILLVHHVELQIADQLGLKRAPSACSINATFDCDAVSRSAWSEFFGFPLGAYGLAFFLSLCVLLVQALRRKSISQSELSGWFVVSSLSFLLSVALFAVSKISVGSFCLYCMGVYGICALMLLVSWWFGRSISFDVHITTGMRHLTRIPRHVLSSDASMTAPRWSAFCILLIAVCSFLMPSFVAARFSEKHSSANASRQDQEIANHLSRWQASNSVPIELELAPGIMVDYGKGEPSGRVRIVEFLDLECPACRHFASEMTEILQLYPQEVHVVLKNYPLDKACNPAILSDMHKNACFFAQASRCAGEQGKFWDAVDFIFESGESQYDSAQEHRREVVRMVDVLSLDPDAFRECMESQRHLEKIQDDIRQGNALHVGGTPSVFVDGKKLPVPSIQLLKAVLAELLGRDPN